MFWMKRDVEEDLIQDRIESIVIEVRDELSKEYNVREGDHEDFRGLCDIATSNFISKMEIFKKIYYDKLKVYSVHGEQRHHPQLESKFWHFQHTWAVVEFYNIKIYVDPTAQQFVDLYDLDMDLPDYYISTKKPFYLYSDRDNPVWNGITHKLNEVIRLKVWDKHRVTYSHLGIIEFFQYEIWGRISDTIHNLIYV